MPIVEIMTDFENNLASFFSIGLSGLICGFLWEGWNWFAVSRWKYNLPYLNKPKIFEMPIAGFLGFIPFAVECFFMWGALEITWRNIESKWKKTITLLIMTSIILLVFTGIDIRTVTSFLKY